jgi:Baseplate J-like protein
MSCSDKCNGNANCTCGCCTGISVMTPQGESNFPGLSSIAYRTGTWATFKASMLARLSSANYPALTQLKTRDDDDFSIALLDATSVVLDILTFYQERLANESYLRTATQLRSLTELARLIGYQPAPGVAASTYLAFSLKAATGLPPNPATGAITIPKGTQVQSVPAQGQKPQTFETSADILAKADWNALPVQTGVPWKPPGANGVYPNGVFLSGTTTQLQLGDSLLILGVDRENWDTTNATPSEQWDAVVLNRVEVDKARDLTYVAWDERYIHNSSGSSGAALSWTTAKVFVFRQKLALFGNNAPNPNLFVDAWDNTQTSLPDLIDDSNPVWKWKWNDFAIPGSDQIYLNAPSPKVVVGSWFALTQTAFAKFGLLSGIVKAGIPRFHLPQYQRAQLYKVTQANATSLAEYALSMKVTELAADYDDPNIQDFALPTTEVWAQSEELTVAEQPLDYPLYGAVLDLGQLRPDLAGIQAIAITGKNQKLTVDSGLTDTLAFTPDDDSGDQPLHPGDVVTILDPAPLPLTTGGDVPDWKTNTEQRDLRVFDANGRTGTIKQARLSDFTLALSGKNDAVTQEFAHVSSVRFVTAPYPHTQILLKSSLLNCYDRNVTTVNANVGLATNGASVSEIMGSGSAAMPNQKFNLRQSPLTFVQSPTPTGRLSTLQVSANSVKWTEVPTLYQQGPSKQVFATLNQPGGGTTVLFGDNVEGATLPTGQNNIQANYRIGSGLGGNVGAGSITTLIDRPLGVSGVTNPMAATGGEDPQTVDDIRSDAPLSVLTLGRAVSITDYQNYASTFAGIAKAYAIWIPSGPGRGVFLSVAAAGGSALPPGNPTLDNLITSLHDYGNPLVPIYAASFLETLFSLEADLVYDPAYDQAEVHAAVLQSLRQNYSFAERDFGQGVSDDEISAFIQAIPGVVAVNVKSLKAVATSAGGDLTSGDWSVFAYNNWLSQQKSISRPCSGSPTRICPYLPLANPTSLPCPAEILVLDPNPKSVVLGVMA